MAHALAGAFVVACKGSSDADQSQPEAAPFDTDAGPAFSDQAMRDAIKAFNTKYCAAFEKFDPEAFAFIMGTRDHCLEAPISQLATNFAFFPADAGLANQFAAFGARMTPDALVKCTNALPLDTMQDWIAFEYEVNTPPECDDVFFGNIPDNGPCAAWNQCAGGRCYSHGLDLNACGTCSSPARLGESCPAFNACPPGSFCGSSPGGGSVCVQPVGENAACDQLTPCRPDLACVQHDGGKRTCTNLGGACDLSVPQAGGFVIGRAHWFYAPTGLPGCAAVPALHYCNQATMKCDPLPVANVNEPCGPDAGGYPHVLCQYGTTCTSITLPADDAGEGGAQTTTFRCKPFAEEGQACNAAAQPFNSQKCAIGVCVLGECRENGPAQCTPPVAVP
jgi:hypothetical protein